MNVWEWRNLDFRRAVSDPGFMNWNWPHSFFFSELNSVRMSILWSFPYLWLRLTVSIPLCESLRSVPCQASYIWLQAGPRQALWMVLGDIILLGCHHKDGPSGIAVSFPHYHNNAFSFLLMFPLSLPSLQNPIPVTSIDSQCFLFPRHLCLISWGAEKVSCSPRIWFLFFLVLS